MNTKSLISTAIAFSVALSPALAATDSVERRAVEAFRDVHDAIAQADNNAERAKAAREFADELGRLKAEGLTLDNFLGALEERDLLSADAAGKLGDLIAQAHENGSLDRWAAGDLSRSEAKELAGALEGTYGATYGYYWGYWYWYIIGFGGCTVFFF